MHVVHVAKGRTAEGLLLRIGRFQGPDILAGPSTRVARPATPLQGTRRGRTSQRSAPPFISALPRLCRGSSLWGGKVSTLSPPYLPKDGGRQETRFGLSECSFFFYGQAIGLPADRALGKVFSPPHKKICPRSLVNCKASQQSRAYS